MCNVSNKTVYSGESNQFIENVENTFRNQEKNNKSEKHVL